jgi:NAD(P)-dependent dehydrogenase (short-subunit alcohol dehydrogenase family)
MVSSTSSQEQKKNILITGCSTGIGLCVAHGLKERGWRVFATARKMVDVDKLKKEGFESCQIDLDVSDSIHSGVQWVLEQSSGRLDALFNNGAYGQPGAMEDITRQAMREQFETNVFGTHELTSLVLPIMRRQGYGRIIQNSSILGFVAMPFRGAYPNFAACSAIDPIKQSFKFVGNQFMGTTS